MSRFIPLLSRPFTDFTPTEFKEHVRSLFFKKTKTKTIKIKEPFTARLNAKGGLVIKVNRSPKWLSHEEIDAIVKMTNVPSNVIFLAIKKRKIQISTQEEMTKINNDLADFPWS